MRLRLADPDISLSMEQQHIAEGLHVDRHRGAVHFDVPFVHQMVDAAGGALEVTRLESPSLSSVDTSGSLQL